MEGPHIRENSASILDTQPRLAPQHSGHLTSVNRGFLPAKLHGDRQDFVTSMAAILPSTEQHTRTLMAHSLSLSRLLLKKEGWRGGRAGEREREREREREIKNLVDSQTCDR